MHQLAHLYADQKEYEKSDSLFLKVNEMGKHVAILCLVSDIYSKARKDKKKFALEILEKNLPLIENDYPIKLFYAKILLWNGLTKKSVDILKSAYNELAQIKFEIEEDINDFKVGHLLAELFNYFTLLLAKKEYKTALELFADNKVIDFKIMLKPFYYVLMESLKKEYPLEYLKAGDEFQDTIKEIKLKINKLQKKI